MLDTWHEYPAAWCVVSAAHASVHAVCDTELAATSLLCSCVVRYSTAQLWSAIHSIDSDGNYRGFVLACAGKGGLVAAPSKDKDSSSGGEKKAAEAKSASDT